MPATPITRRRPAWPLPSSVDRQALVNQQVNWAAPQRAGGDQPHLRAGPGRATTPRPPRHADRPSRTADDHLDHDTVGQGGSVNFPATSDPTRRPRLMDAAGYFRTAPDPWDDVWSECRSRSALAVDEGDPWAAARRRSCRRSCRRPASRSPSFPSRRRGGRERRCPRFGRPGAAAATSSPFLSQAVAWYTPICSARPGRTARRTGRATTTPPSTTGHHGVATAQSRTRRRPTTPQPTPAVGRTWWPCPSSPNPVPGLEPHGGRSDADPRRATASCGTPSTGPSGSPSPPTTRRRRCPAIGRRRAEGQSVPARYDLWALLRVARQSEWRNRQTRQLEGLVPARAWGFKSPLRHVV